MKKTFNWIRNKKGATMVEYSVLVGLISVAAIVTIALVGPQLNAAWVAVNGALTAAGF